MRKFAFILVLTSLCLLSCRHYRRTVDSGFDFTDSDGSIVVFGTGANVDSLTRYMLRCDNFDNVSGRAKPDGLPDFSGETIARVLVLPSTRIDSMSVVMKACMDTVAYTSVGMELRQVSKRRGKYFIAPADTSLAERVRLSTQCWRVMRQRNVFTHKISYPATESYVAIKDSEGQILILDSND